MCHLAYHEIFGRNVVQKTISLLGLEDALAYQEPRLLDQLRHENLVEVREAQWDPDQPEIRAITFTMPYYEGGSIYAALMDDYRFSIGEAVRIVCQILDALHYLHADERLVHRDVKPGNVFLSPDKRKTFLGDLGSAARVDEKGFGEARAGTPLYLPPEYSRGLYSFAGDLYGTGMILLELLNGRFKYEEIDGVELRARNEAGQRALKDKFYVPGPHVSGQLYSIVRKMINARLEQRPADAQEAQRALRAAVHLDWRLSGQAYSEESEEIEWLGHKEHSTKDKLRLYRVCARRAGKKLPQDQFDLTAQWRNSESDPWRGIPSIATRASFADVAAWRQFFKKVSDVAQRWAAK